MWGRHFLRKMQSVNVIESQSPEIPLALDNFSPVLVYSEVNKIEGKKGYSEDIRVKFVASDALFNFS